MSHLSLSENLLLRAASADGGAAAFPAFSHVPFEPGHQFAPGRDRRSPMVFPLRGILSLQLASGVDKQVEIGQVGREGMAGLSHLLSGKEPRILAVTLTAGEALVVQAADGDLLLNNAAFRAALNSYLRLTLVMFSRMAVCNRIHAIEKVFVGRLLLMQDRSQVASFPVTQDGFARDLAVRRATISRVAARLRKLGAIQYDNRGRLAILDRSLLEGLSCSCYRAMKAEFDLLVKSHGGL